MKINNLRNLSGIVTSIIILAKVYAIIFRQTINGFINNEIDQIRYQCTHFDSSGFILIYIYLAYNFFLFIHNNNK